MKPMSQRAGRYVDQPSGYRAFVPRPLPPDPPVHIDEDMWHHLSTAERALGRLDGATTSLPNSDLFVMMYVRKEAVLSSQIEGTQASLTDLLEAEAKVFRPKSASDTAEVINYVSAMNYGLERLKTLPLSLRLLREIHARLMEGTRGQELTPGEFRRSQNWIGPGGSTLSNATFVPPPVEEMREALAHWENFLHDPKSMPLLIRIGLAHAQFETIHPFLDGNGRVGRLLITFTLCEKQALQQPLLYLSHFFKQNRQEYYDRLQAVRDLGDWEGWLRYFLRGVALVADEATRVARKIIELRERQRREIQASLGRVAPDGLSLYDRMFNHPFVEVSSAQEMLQKDFRGANTVIARLETLGILREVSGRKRNRVFVHHEYLKLFDDSEILAGEVL